MKHETRIITGSAPDSGSTFRCALLATIALLFASSSARADYPIVSQRYAADPTGVEFNGRLYLYCSNDDDNGTNGYVMHSLTCFSTDDLKNWIRPVLNSMGACTFIARTMTTMGRM